MKFLKPFRYLFLLLLIAMGAIVAIKGSSVSSTKDIKTKSTKTCCKKTEPSSTSNEFISFDTFNRFLLINPVR